MKSEYLGACFCCSFNNFVTVEPLFVNYIKPCMKYMSYFVDKGVINLKDISVISGVYENDIFDDNSKYLDFKVEPMWSVIKY